MMFVTHNRYKCFGKQTHIDTCLEAFKECEKFGFEFGEFGFAGNHVHFQVNIPKRYSLREKAPWLSETVSKRWILEWL